MVKGATLFAAIAFAAGTASAIGASTPKSKVHQIVPKGTPIVVQTVNAINSATFHDGERLAYVVTNDVIVNGTLVARAGDAAAGVVQNAVEGHQTRAGAAGKLLGPVGAVAGAAVNKAGSKGSNLRVSVQTVSTFCGGTIPVSFVRSEYHKPKRFHRMTAVQIAKGQEYVTLVARDTKVCAAPTTRTPAPIPNGALHGDQITQ